MEEYNIIELIRIIIQNLYHPDRKCFSSLNIKVSQVLHHARFKWIEIRYSYNLLEKEASSYASLNSCRTN